MNTSQLTVPHGAAWQAATRPPFLDGMRSGELLALGRALPVAPPESCRQAAAAFLAVSAFERAFWQMAFSGARGG